MTKKRLNEIKSHFRLYAPKNIHKELAELFKYIQGLENRCDDLESRVQGSLFDFDKTLSNHLLEAHAKKFGVDENE